MSMPVAVKKPLPKFLKMPVFRPPPPRGLAGRLRALRSHELAFVAAGVGILILAPMAEYLISGKGEAPGFRGGFGQNGGESPFPESAVPYEGGLGIAQGGLMGQGRDVVTPLGASKDPLSMIMKLTGADGASSSDVPPAEKKEDARDAPASPAANNSWKEALTSAKSAVKEAVHRAPGLPRPAGKLSTALRDLSSAAGGGGSSATSGASAPAMRLESPSSKGLVGSPRKDSAMTHVSPVPGFRGTGTRGLASGVGSGGGTRGGSGAALSAGGFLQEVVAGGSSSGGRAVNDGSSGRAGDATGSPGGNAAKDAKTLTGPSGENLGALRQKLELQKSIDLKYAKLQYDQLDRKKMLEQITAQTLAQTAQQAIGKILDKVLGLNQNKNNNQQQAAQQQGQQQPQLPQAPPNIASAREVPVSPQQLKDAGVPANIVDDLAGKGFAVFSSNTDVKSPNFRVVARGPDGATRVLTRDADGTWRVVETSDDNPEPILYDPKTGEKKPPAAATPVPKDAVDKSVSPPGSSG